LLFVFELAEVHDFTHGRIGIWRDFYKIQLSLFGQLQGFGGVYNANIFTFGPDEAHLGCADTVVNAGAGFALRRRVVRSAGYGFVPSMVGLSMTAQRKPAALAVQAARLAIFIDFRALLLPM